MLFIPHNILREEKFFFFYHFGCHRVVIHEQFNRSGPTDHIIKPVRLTVIIDLEEHWLALADLPHVALRLLVAAPRMYVELLVAHDDLVRDPEADCISIVDKVVGEGAAVPNHERFLPDRTLTGPLLHATTPLTPKDLGYAVLLDALFSRAY